MALPLFEDDISPRFCFAKSALIVEWNGSQAATIGKVRLGNTPYPARLELLANRSVRWLLCGSFPRERLVDATRCGIAVCCGIRGTVPERNDELGAFISRLEIDFMSRQTLERLLNADNGVVGGD